MALVTGGRGIDFSATDVIYDLSAVGCLYTDL
jgi:hypothetical protein